MELTGLVPLLAAPWRRLARWLGLGASAERYVGYVAGLAGVAVASLFIGLVIGQARIANISMLYLLAGAMVIDPSPTVARCPAIRSGPPFLSHAQLDHHFFDVVGRACRLALWSRGSVEQTGLIVGEPPLVPPGQSGATDAAFVGNVAE